MKKLLIMILIIGTVVLPGCSEVESVEQRENKTSMFVEIEESYCWKVVYHKETKVMYVVSYAAYNCGNFTALLNADGTPMLYEDK